MNNDANTICIVLKCCMSLVLWQVIVHATILHCSLFIVHLPHFNVHSFHNIVQPDLQHVVQYANCAFVHHFEKFAPTLLESFPFTPYIFIKRYTWSTNFERIQWKLSIFCSYSEINLASSHNPKNQLQRLFKMGWNKYKKKNLMQNLI